MQNLSELGEEGEGPGRVQAEPGARPLGALPTPWPACSSRPSPTWRVLPLLFTCFLPSLLKSHPLLL